MLKEGGREASSSFPAWVAKPPGIPICGKEESYFVLFMGPRVRVRRGAIFPPPPLSTARHAYYDPRGNADLWREGSEKRRRGKRRRMEIKMQDFLWGPDAAS